MTVGAQSKSVYTLQPVVQPVEPVLQPIVQPAGQNVLNIHIINKYINRVEFVEFCNRSNFCHSPGSYATKCKNK